jgi:hypothetical protein
MSEPTTTTLCECANWCRDNIASPYNIRRRDGVMLMTNHHPNCLHYNDSLIDVWKLTCDGVSAYLDDKQDAINCMQEEFEDEITITKEKMHREIFEHLPEFEGF